MTDRRSPTTGLPPRAGVGLKPMHYADILQSQPDIGWLELHPENYMGAGGPSHHYLERLRALHPLSFHGVGLSIGSAQGLAQDHLQRLRKLLERYQPASFSEHLAWSSHGGIFMNDLLPLPYTQQTLALVIRHVDQTQQALGRRILIENPSTYLRFAHQEMTETEFLAELARRSGCGLLLDINNAHVSAVNHGFDAQAYIDAFPAAAVEEIHLAGHAMGDDGEGGRLLIDAHDRPVDKAVLALYRRFLLRAGPRPTLIEWDNDIPAWDILLAEARQADAIMAECREAAHAA